MQTHRNSPWRGVGSFVAVLAASLWTQPGLAQGDLSYVIENGTITIVAGGCPSNSVLSIPETIDGLPVTRIYDYAFAECTNLTSITIPKSVTSVGSPVFYGCSSLTSIAVDAANPSYSSLGGVLFNKTRTLLVACPGAKTGDYVVPGSVGSIGSYAFSACTNLSSITIPNSVTTIGENAFYGCTSTTNITIPNSVASIGGGAFWDCTSLTRITIPNSLTSIESYTFANCASLRTVTIPDSVTIIWDNAFGGCTSLTNVVIGNGVDTIWSFTFHGCTSLTTIEVDPANLFYSSLDGTLFDKSQTVLLVCPAGKTGTFIIPNGVTSVGDGAFVGCTSLTHITIPDSVTSIGSSAFTACRNLTSITMPTSVTSVGSFAFNGCTSLTSITIPNNVTSIESYTFQGCASLVSITIPKSLAIIGALAFSDCTSLRGAYFQGNAPNADPLLFPGTDNVTVYYLAGTTGWASTFGERPTALWKNPLLFAGSGGVSGNGFALAASWAPNAPLVVEACADLASPSWSPISTNTPTSGSWTFFDPYSSIHPKRFYRVRSP